MSSSTQNMYSGNNKTFLELFDSIEQDGKIDEDALMLLCNSEQVDILERFRLLRLASDKNCKYTNLLLKFLADNSFLTESPEILEHMQDYFYRKAYRASLLTDNEVIQLWRYHAYMLSQGIAEFYPYIWHLICRHGKITTFSDSNLKIISYYSAVFKFDGFNADRIKEILRRASMCSERDLDIFKQLKSKRESACSKYTASLLYIMQRAFKRQKFNSDKFNNMLSDIPEKYRDKLYVDSLLNNSEKLYCSLKSFYKNGGHRQVHDLTVKN